MGTCNITISSDVPGVYVTGNANANGGFDLHVHVAADGCERKACAGLHNELNRSNTGELDAIDCGATSGVSDV